MTGTPGPSAWTGGRIPSLDGLRALSILFVIVAHVYRPFAQLGDVGVGVFFVISGFLITWLLVAEIGRTGRIDLLDFYRRRAYRIWPAFYAFLATVAVLTAAGLMENAWKDFVLAGTFIWNYLPGSGSWWLGHTWSLSVEEQFYLLWPAALLLLGLRGGRRLAIGIILLSPAIRVVQFYALSVERRPSVVVMLHTRADALMAGCLLALLLADARWARPIRRLAASPLLPIVAAVFVFGVSPLLRVGEGPRYMLAFGWSLEALAITLIIAATTLNPQTIAGRVLNTRWLSAIGVRSYSLYLWQQLFTHGSARLESVPVVLRLAALVVAAELSYRLVELPMLALRQRRQRRQDRRALAAVEAQAAGAG